MLSEISVNDSFAVRTQKRRKHRIKNIVVIVEGVEKFKSQKITQIRYFSAFAVVSLTVDKLLNYVETRNVEIVETVKLTISTVEKLRITHLHCIRDQYNILRFQCYSISPIRRFSIPK